MSGPKRYAGAQDSVGEFRLGNRSHVCVGGLGTVPEGGTLRVDLAEGTSYQDTCVDGCCIVFAPASSPPAPDDRVTVRVIDADGRELSADRVWIGDGRPPPSDLPR